MSKKTNFTTEQHLRSVPLPHHGKRYAVVPHGHIIDQTREDLNKAGFGIIRELYKTTQDGEIAQGIYHLDYCNDPDMGMMFAWSNSYNKSLRFKCAIGAQVFICMNGVVSGDLANYQRKHTGSALHDIKESIKYQISHAMQHYDSLIADKDMLKQVDLNKAEQAAIVGRLLIEQDILTLTQVNIVRQQIEKPVFEYSDNPNSAWDLYNHVTLSLKDSHPYSYLSDHQRVHTFFVNEFGRLVTTSPVKTTEELVSEIPSVTDFSVNFL